MKEKKPNTKKKALLPSPQDIEHRFPEIELTDLWGLDTTLAFIISKYLEEFIDAIQLCGATPGGIYENFEAWKADLEKMRSAFRAYYDKKYTIMFDMSEEDSEKEMAIIKEGMHLFVDRYEHLWY